MTERWTVHFLNEMVFAEMDEQPEDTKAHFLRLCDLVAAHGLERMREIKIALKRAKEVK